MDSEPLPRAFGTKFRARERVRRCVRACTGKNSFSRASSFQRDSEVVESSQKYEVSLGIEKAVREEFVNANEKVISQGFLVMVTFSLGVVIVYFIFISLLL